MDLKNLRDTVYEALQRIVGEKVTETTTVRDVFIAFNDDQIVITVDTEDGNAAIFSLNLTEAYVELS